MRTIPWDKVDIQALTVETHMLGKIFPGMKLNDHYKYKQFIYICANIMYLNFLLAFLATPLLSFLYITLALECNMGPFRNTL